MFVVLNGSMDVFNFAMDLQNYWVSRRSMHDESSSQQSSYQHDAQISSKAGVVITSFRQSHRRFVLITLRVICILSLKLSKAFVSIKIISISFLLNVECH